MCIRDRIWRDFGHAFSFASSSSRGMYPSPSYLIWMCCTRFPLDLSLSLIHILFNVSTDFLLGETNIPDRKNYDIAELGLSVEAAKSLYTGRVNTEVVNLLLENARFAELTYRIAQYFDDTVTLQLVELLTTLHLLAWTNREKNKQYLKVDFQ